MPDHQT